MATKGSKAVGHLYQMQEALKTLIEECKAELSYVEKVAKEVGGNVNKSPAYQEAIAVLHHAESLVWLYRGNYSFPPTAESQSELYDEV